MLTSDGWVSLPINQKSLIMSHISLY